jgi:hypothetical protein
MALPNQSNRMEHKLTITRTIYENPKKICEYLRDEKFFGG